MKSGDLIIVAVLVLGILVISGKLTLPNLQQTGQQNQIVVQQSFGELVTLNMKGLNTLTGSQVAGNAEVTSSSGEVLVGETSVSNTGTTTLSQSLPNKFDGYLMFGNDNYVGTDRGDELYFTKVPLSWETQGLVSKTVLVYSEGTPAWTFYDGNTAETTPNITISVGGVYTDASIKLASDADEALGNPELPGSLGVCFGESQAGLFKEIKPSSYAGTFVTPKSLRDKNIVSCYILGDAIKDGEKKQFDLFIQAESGEDPGASDYIKVYLMDKTYYKDEYGKWQVGWGFDNNAGTATDVGIDGATSVLTI